MALFLVFSLRDIRNQIIHQSLFLFIHLDQTIDYSGKVKLPASVGNISKLMTLDLKIGGSFTSPKVSVDTKSMANQAVEAVADEAISKLGQKLGLDSAATANKDSIKQKVTEKAAEKALDFLKKKLK